MGVLFNEELGAILQVRRADTAQVMQTLLDSGLRSELYVLGSPNHLDSLRIMQKENVILDEARTALQQAWSSTSHHMQRLRDNPQCADEEYAKITDTTDTGLYATLSFDPQQDICAPFINTAIQPRIAILREQGVNGHIEMAAAFNRAHFDAIDVHMSDIISGRVSLKDFHAFAACGGFSYGDVLGAGEGWAKSILFNTKAHDEFSQFFTRPDTIALGVCNGCQMMSNLAELIPGTQAWPKFTRNQSEQFEARLVMVEIMRTSSLFLNDMGGSQLPVVISHGEGFANFAQQGKQNDAYIALRFLDNQGQPTQTYPYNPNGSPAGITGITTADGRFTIMMPHPERTFRTVQASWHPADWGEDHAWLRMFRNARRALA
jgi:phosphoribosylformylglycinamidine synthase